MNYLDPGLISPVKCIKASPTPLSGLGYYPFLGCDSVVVYSLFVVAPIVWGFCVESLSCGVVLSVLSSLAITLLRKRELVALVLWLLVFCLQSVIVAFPGHTHSFFSYSKVPPSSSFLQCQCKNEQFNPGSRGNQLPFPGCT